MATFDSDITKGTETWNIAQGYTYLKILKLLVDLDKYLNISLYGTEHIEETFNQPQAIKTQMRLIAADRLLESLKIIIENTKFVLSKPNKELVEGYKKQIINIELNLSVSHDLKIDARTNETATVINEKQFKECLDALRKIKEEINEPLNQANLIFPSSDEIDLDKLQNKLIYGG